jgi:hypothetical protein
MRKRNGYEEHHMCGICVEPLDMLSRSEQNPTVHAKCWNVTRQHPRGLRRSFLEGPGALTHRAEGEKAHG